MFANLKESRSTKKLRATFSYKVIVNNYGFLSFNPYCHKKVWWSTIVKKRCSNLLWTSWWFWWLVLNLKVPSQLTPQARFIMVARIRFNSEATTLLARIPTALPYITKLPYTAMCCLESQHTYHHDHQPTHHSFPQPPHHPPPGLSKVTVQILSYLTI